jgi:hypothetical protein
MSRILGTTPSLGERVRGAARAALQSHRISAFGAALAAAALLSTSAAADDSKPKLTSVAKFAECTEGWGADRCLDALHVYVNAHPDEAFAAGTAVTLNLHHWAAMPFFERALSVKGATKHCGDQRLALAVTSALGLPRDAQNGATVTSAQKVLTLLCWRELQPVVLDALAKGNPYVAKNVCPLLAERKQSAAACQPKAERAAAPAPTAGWESLDPSKLEIEGPAKVYRGDEGRRLTLAKVKGKPYYLIKFEGFRGAWNGKVLLHREDASGTGFDYWTKLADRRYVSLVARRPWGSHYDYEVYPRGDDGPFNVTYDEKASQAANPKALLAELAK